MTPLEAAHEYCRHGWGIVPLYGVTDDGACRCNAGPLCTSAGKHPHGRGGSWNVLKGGADVQAWFDDNPADNLGIVTGPDSGIFVFDVDPEHGGMDSIVFLTKEYGPLPPTRIVKTGSGGLHYYYRHPANFVVYNSTSYLAEGIDIRGKGGQVVAPPSVSSKGDYRLLSDIDIVDGPEWMLKLLAEHSEHKERGHSAQIRVAEHVDAELLPERVAHLRSQLVGMDEGRYKHFHGLVAACYEAGYTQGQAVTIVAPWCAAVGKFVGRVEQEVARCWGKLEAASQRANEWIEGLGDRPTGAPEWPGATQINTASNVPTAEPGTRATASSSTATESASSAGIDGTPSSTDDIKSSWAPIDPKPILSGNYQTPTADLFPRDDGHNLLYRGLVHSFHGESESGKSMIAQGEVARLLIAGGTAAYIDFESDPMSVYGRLREMGVPIEILECDRFTYRRPEVDPFGMPIDRDAYANLLGQAIDLIVVDGVTDALGVFGAGTNDADEVSDVFRRFFRRVAQRTGAAVVLVDHVTKNSETRGRHAVGSQAKMNALDGAAYLIEVAEVLGQGMRGVVTMRVGKDRPGGVRGNGVSVKDGRTGKDRTQLAANVVIDSTQGGIRVVVEAPDATPVREVEARRARGRMDHIKEDLCRYMLEIGEPMSGAGAERWANSCGIGQKAARAAFDELKGTHHFRASGSRGGQPLYVVAEPFSPSTSWISEGTSATLADLGTTSANQGRDHLGSTPIPLGGAEVGGGGGEATSAKSIAEVDKTTCVSCSKQILASIAARLEGRCGTCARGAGLS